MPGKRILCLANSRKLQGRCIAGKELVGDRAVGWIRPVSSREHQEVSEYERQYQDGSDPRVLDIIDVPLIEPRPHGCQQENWLLDPDAYWAKVRSVDCGDLDEYLDVVPTLWVNGHSTYNGLNDKVPQAIADTLGNSLCLIKVAQLQLVVFTPGEAFGNPKRRVQARFTHERVSYHIWVTDPGYERAYLARQDGGYNLGTCFVTVSLGEPHLGACYKLAAAIIECPKGDAQ